MSHVMPLSHMAAVCGNFFMQISSHIQFWRWKWNLQYGEDSIPKYPRCAQGLQFFFASVILLHKSFQFLRKKHYEVAMNLHSVVATIQPKIGKIFQC